MPPSSQTRTSRGVPTSKGPTGMTTRDWHFEYVRAINSITHDVLKIDGVAYENQKRVDRHRESFFFSVHSTRTFFFLLSSFICFVSRQTSGNSAMLSADVRLCSSSTKLDTLFVINVTHRRIYTIANVNGDNSSLNPRLSEFSNN